MSIGSRNRPDFKRPRGQADKAGGDAVPGGQDYLRGHTSTGGPHVSGRVSKYPNVPRASST